MPAAHRAHAGWTPSGLDRLGPQDRTVHGRVRRTTPRDSQTPRTGLPQLPRAQGVAAGLRRRAPGGRLPPRTRHRHAELWVRQVHPRDRPRPSPATSNSTRSPCPPGTPTSTDRSTTPTPKTERSPDSHSSPTHPRPASRTPSLGHGPGPRGADRHARHQRAVLRRPPLPAPRTREDRKQWIRDGQTVLVSGATGSGKSYRDGHGVGGRTSASDLNEDGYRAIAVLLQPLLEISSYASDQPSTQREDDIPLADSYGFGHRL